MVQCGRAGLILSIPAQEVSLGSPRVGTIHVHAPTPHAPPLQAFLAISLTSAAHKTMNRTDPNRPQGHLLGRD